MARIPCKIALVAITISEMRTSLIQEIQREKDHLERLATSFPIPFRSLKEIDGTGGKVSISDLIAYQIGWGKCLIRWYETGLKGDMPAMPGDGFLKWNYKAIAKHFYQKYSYNSSEQQLKVFGEVVAKILEIVEREDQTGDLDRLGVWPWCTLASGKQWPLSKWIRVNTVAPYRRAVQLLKKADQRT